MRTKITKVHNELEAKALLKEARENGSIHEYDNTFWYTHDNAYIFTSFVLADSIEGNYYTKQVKVSPSQEGLKEYRANYARILKEQNA